MKYLVDANVLSEPTKPSVNQRVVDWLRTHQAEFVVNAVVMAEIWRGVDALDPGGKKSKLLQWYQDVCQTVTCLDWTLDTAIVWGSPGQPGEALRLYRRPQRHHDRRHGETPRPDRRYPKC